MDEIQGRCYNALHGFCVSAFVRSLSPLLSHTKRYCFAFLYQSVFYVSAAVAACHAITNVMVSTRETFSQRLGDMEKPIEACSLISRKSDESDLDHAKF